MNKTLRRKKHQKIRKIIAGSSQIPRLAVFKSSRHIFVQAIDDSKGTTIAQANDLKMKGMPKSQKAYEVGKAIADKLQKQGIKKCVFDRAGFLYHGRIEMLAKGARERLQV